MTGIAQLAEQEAKMAASDELDVDVCIASLLAQSTESDAPALTDAQVTDLCAAAKVRNPTGRFCLLERREGTAYHRWQLLLA